MKSILLVITLFILVSPVLGQEENNQKLPVVVSAVAPVYPAVALALNLQGDFFVDVEIDQSGKVISSKAVDGTHKLMRKVIETAADRWRFESDKTAEKKRQVKLTFSFRPMPNAESIDSTTVFYPPYKIEVRENSVLKDSTGLPFLKNKPKRSS
ncbi:MAG TPA: energy transducer TonB [Pyrinomonadaceae bacterium]|jgi:TonB family protein